MAKNLALSLRKWHKKNLIGENGGERKINPSANPVKVKKIFRQNIQYLKKIYNLTPLYSCTVGYSKFTVSNQKEVSIIIQRVNVFQFICEAILVGVHFPVVSAANVSQRKEI